MPLKSAGIMLFRRRWRRMEVFLVHPGGPLWVKKDNGAWTIPKGLIGEGEDPVDAALREFREETGLTLDRDCELLGEFRQPGGKVVVAFAVEGDLDPAKLDSNYFTMEWPPRSGQRQSFPEIDRGDWFTPEEAAEKLLQGQVPILEAVISRYPP